MKKPNTQLLLKELKETSDIASYVTRFEKDLKHLNLEEYLTYLLTLKNKKKSDVITASGIHRTYAYQMFSGQKAPSRDKLLALAFGFPLNAEETNKLLSHGGYNPLHPRNRRDATILFGLMNNKSLDETNDLLYDIHELCIE